MGELENAEDLVGQVVEDRYRIEALLGKGAMGVVYRARHVKFGREVAIKVLHDHLVRDDVMLARFDREAAIAARLDHPNVICVFDVGETPAKQKLMVLELARGETLGDIVARGPMSAERIIRLVAQLLRGLDHAHDAGLVHRDLKPDNVIVTTRGDDDCAKIVDFGIAVLRGGGESVAAKRLTEAGIVLGTPAYMAPEQAYADAPDPRSDLFALGVMVYEMLCGVQPFGGTSVEIIMANVTQDPPAIERRAPGVEVDPLLEAFARRLMARRIAERFQSAREALAMLELIERDRAAATEALGIVEPAPVEPTAPTTTVPCAPVPEPVRPAPRWRTLLGGTAVVVGAALGHWLVCLAG